MSKPNLVALFHDTLARYVTSLPKRFATVSCAILRGANFACSRSRAAAGIAFLLAVATPFPVLSQDAEHPPLQVRKWSGSINVPDPVAVGVDDLGRVFVTQTKRRKIQDLDIRANRDWIPDDVGLSSVEDKRNFFKQRLAIGGDQADQKQRVDDWNQDGQHDWRDLTVVSEVIYRLSDTNADGTADEMTVFAEDFKTEVTGIAAGVMPYAGSVYATVAPDLWRLQDVDDDGVADTQESIAHGFGLHIAYAGHDMHGLTVGPDGRIYWSIGDKGIHVESPDGRIWHYPNQGGVMRCDPDGSNFEVFAHGLRNVQEFAFDKHGNIFGVDNDADQPDERERFVNILEGMDAGWRCNYQYRGGQYNPWTDEHLWELPGENHPAYIVPPLSHYIDGPAGFKYNPGTALSESYVDYFFLTGAPNGYQYAFRAEPSGDTFRMSGEHLIGSGTAIVGLAFGPDGGLYGADWDGGYPLDEKGSVVRLDVPEEFRHPSREEVRLLLQSGFASTEGRDLIELLGHEDQRIRMGAQFELVRRDDAYALSTTAADKARPQLARLHAMWGLAQLGRRGDLLARDTIGLLLTDDDDILRGQSAKAYSEMPRGYGTALIPLLSDKSPQVQVLAGIGLGRLPATQAFQPLLNAATKLTREQHNLRHALVMGLSACATSEELAGQISNDSEMVRMCCVLALRKQRSALVSKYLNDSSSWIVADAVRAIHDDLSIEAAMPELATFLKDCKHQERAIILRVINANFRLGDKASADRLTQYAANRDNPQPLRIAALDAIAAWMEPPLLDRVDGRRRILEAERHFRRDEISRVLTEIFTSDAPSLQAAALATASALNLELDIAALRLRLSDKETDAEVRVAALNALLSQVDLLVIDALNSEDPSVRAAGTTQLDRLSPGAKRQLLKTQLARASELDLIVLQSLIRLLEDSVDGDSSQRSAQLEQLADKVSDGQLSRGVALEVVSGLKRVAPESPRLSSLLELGQSVAEKEELAEFGLALEGGDAQLGKAIFNEHVGAQCSRCHRVGQSGSEIGPPLTDIATKRDAKYLLRAILEPSADIDAKYRTTQLLLVSGNVVKGVVLRQDDNVTVLADAEGKEIEIANDEIDDQFEDKTSLMPEMTKVLSPREVRDLLAYLLSLKSE